MLPYLTTLFYFDGETALAACVLRVTTKKGRQLFFRKKVHPGDLVGEFSDLEMTWLLYCAGAATVINGVYTFDTLILNFDMMQTATDCLTMTHAL